MYLVIFKNTEETQCRWKFYNSFYKLWILKYLSCSPLLFSPCLALIYQDITQDIAIGIIFKFGS